MGIKYVTDQKGWGWDKKEVAIEVEYRNEKIRELNQ